MKYKWLGVFASFVVLLNGLFIGLELYKENIRNQWANDQKLAHLAFLELEKLNNWTVYIEFTLSISILFIAVWLIIKKSHLLREFIIMNVSVQLFFIIVGSFFAMYFQVAMITLVQQQIGQIFILLMLVVYRAISHFGLNRQVAKRKLS